MKKDKKWLMDEIIKIGVVKHYLYSDSTVEVELPALDYAIDQLDEPEVLSEKWISENVEYAYFMIGDSERLSSATAIIKPEKLKNLLVPKQELPVIPQWVAEDIESKKRVGTRLNVAMSDFPEFKLQKELDIDEHQCNEIYARAWLDGYTVEEEQKYYVIDKEENILLIRGYEGIEKADNLKIANSGGGALKLTEQEIKDYDPRFWAFAVKVEELEE